MLRKSFIGNIHL